MELIPEWAPNLHPMLVHFPIALLLGAIGADVMALGLRRWAVQRPLNWLRPATVALYVAGAVSAVVTYFTGSWAADAVSVPAAAEATLSEHANLGWWTMWFFGIYALVRLGAHLWPKTRERVSVHVVLLLVALGGGYLLYETGEHGAEMVYRYGVGVQQAEAESASVEPGLTIGENGWQWQPQSDTAWTSRMTWLEGRPTDVQASLDTTNAGRVVLALRPTAPVTFVVPDTLGAVQFSAEMNLDGFEGTASLLHHVQGAQSYDFLTVDGSTLQQGRMTDGTRSTFATSTVDGGGWRTIRAVGDGTHFRGYVDGEMMVHGHGDAAEPGSVGLRLEGTGTVRILRLAAESL
ncbi:hypothetical protein BSZ35_16280 [Salinibacter sp. 10B]|uniref:DUF2231 domain-containing protein n=1 Tax=Salinibacter sp. 10B TaxID=1923971 RepID=UPI000CF40364|nr:DUF2231 domain-containing protein [Salinibacter sp. 10B]PQJ35952.1 hypothetical protein BSZ35_16280 [Salinibacter sp. 10B]